LINHAKDAVRIMEDNVNGADFKAIGSLHGEDCQRRTGCR
jgi:hypothetical protein